MRQVRGTLSILILSVTAASLMFFALPRTTEAAFGISPPFMNIGTLMPGSRYIQTIYLVQDQPNEDLTIQAKLDVPQTIRSWFKLTPGERFSIPQGTRQFAFSIEVNVPKDTELGAYRGTLTFTTLPNSTGQVTIALGAQVDINLTVGNDIHRQMTIPIVKPLDIEEGWNPRIYVKVNNEGNIAERFDGGTFELLDQFGAARLAYVQKGREDFPEIPSFTVKEFTVEVPVNFHLGLGQYWASITLMQEGKVVGSQRTVFNVLKEGSLSTPFQKWLQRFQKSWPYYGGGALALLLIGGMVWLFRRKRQSALEHQ